MIKFLAVLHAKNFDYRALEGIMRVFSEMNFSFPVISYTQICRRVNNLDISFDIDEDDLVVAIDGSASNKEMEEEVAKILNLSEEQLNSIHRANRTKFSYRLAWTRTYLKNYGVIENSSRGVWSLTEKGLNLHEVDKEEVNNFVKNLHGDKKSSIEEEIEEKEEWKTRILEIMMSLDPSAFERLCQRVLRESGFEEVKVTGRTGDGGIDDEGIYRLGDLLSLKVIFQCKRWKGSVPAKEIRDFRGSMVGRTNKGLFITTGIFTRDARDEAERDGSFTIDLINGEKLAQKIKDLGMGVKIEEDVNIKEDWFKSI